MNLPELSTLIDRISDSMRVLAIRKNSDYSKDEDVHSNFRELAALCKTLNVDVKRPEGCLQYMVLHKIHRMFKLINEGKSPENESLFDNAVDANVYQALLLGIGQKGKNGQ